MYFRFLNVPTQPIRQPCSPVNNQPGVYHLVSCLTVRVRVLFITSTLGIPTYM